MNITDIKNTELNRLVKSALKANSDAIAEDIEDGLYYSESDTELLSELKSSLEELKKDIDDTSQLARWVAGKEYDELKRETENYLNETAELI
jgi:F0F1-type ATP synthase membrane subunit b/b'